MSPIPILFVWLLPKRADVTKVQACLAYLALQDSTEPPTEITKLVLEYNKLDEKQIKALKIKDPRTLRRSSEAEAFEH